MPYLYIICAKNISVLSSIEFHKELFIGPKSIEVRLLLATFFRWWFFLIFQGQHRWNRDIKKIIDTYEAASGQAINLNKSEIAFSSNVNYDIWATIANSLGLGSYLDLPPLIGRGKNSVFFFIGFINDCTWSRVQYWSSKCLCRAGNKVLTTSAVQSIPTYCMSAFRLPSTLTLETEHINSF